MQFYTLQLCIEKFKNSTSKVKSSNRNETNCLMISLLALAKGIQTFSKIPYGEEELIKPWIRMEAIPAVARYRFQQSRSTTIFENLNSSELAVNLI